MKGSIDKKSRECSSLVQVSLCWGYLLSPMHSYSAVLCQDEAETEEYETLRARTEKSR